jgi:hypothetical protein
MDVTQTPYASWLEELIGMLLELKPEKIAVAAIAPNGEVLTGYYGDCTHVDKAVMGYHMNLDATMDVVEANAREIVRAAEDTQGGETENC